MSGGSTQRPELRNHSTPDEEAENSLQANATETQSLSREAKTIWQPPFKVSGCFSLLLPFTTRMTAFLQDWKVHVVFKAWMKGDMAYCLFLDPKKKIHGGVSGNNTHQNKSKMTILQPRTWQFLVILSELVVIQTNAWIKSLKPPYPTHP